MSKVVHVAAAVIKNSRGEVLIAKRPAHVHMGGLWEFPGGKLEPTESATEALTRELHEELGIHVRQTEPLIQILHRYPGKTVHLDVSIVTAFDGIAEGKEGQEVRWVTPKALKGYTFPDANYPIVNAALLPHQCFISGEATSVDQYVARIAQAAGSGASLFILRPTQVVHDAGSLEKIIQGLAELTHCKIHWHERWFEGDYGKMAALLGKSANYGGHFSARAMAQGVPALGEHLAGVDCSASCHSAGELAQAAALGCAFALLSPVKATKDYGPESLLGWQGFQAHVAEAPVPVYALGGLSATDEQKARDCGGQGVAFVRDWWA
ncbi:Nudix family hydrolase [Simiduia sp. 21SJ11W-1]|uniref:Nudix family hydrolase n=1 Tax=Simiduia sp. 21SJ11W-1 TaxID=2909669 RepID=UPI0020A116B1|nr:Nudix family hydrolase [Simiduia sp. 21SJ11W-1]UTA48879.1 Nudix family hydrolase [Simiduia sp. 21SJ11W-1]